MLRIHNHIPIIKDNNNQKKYNPIGMTIGELKIISETNIKKGSRYFVCECSCGQKNIIRRIDSLMKHKHAHCGNKSHYFVGLIRKVYFNIIEKEAKQRKIPFDITIEYINDLFIKQNGKCIYTNVILTLPQCSYTKGLYQHTASLDRIDSSKGYIEGNVQWVHKDINNIKWDFNEKEWLNWIEKIYNYRIKPSKEQEITDYCI